MKGMRIHLWIYETITIIYCRNKRQLIRKPTDLCGTKEVLQNLSRRCKGTHEHEKTEGSMRVPDADVRWKTVNVSKEFAGAILRGAAGFLQNRYEVNGNLKVNGSFLAKVDFQIPHGVPEVFGPKVAEKTGLHRDLDEDVDTINADVEDIASWLEEELPQDADLLIKVTQEISAASTSGTW